MKIVVIFYIVSTLVYFAIGTGSSYWAVFNMLSVLGVMAFFMYCVSNRLGTRFDRGTKWWIDFAILMTAVRMIYTTSCGFAPYEWIYFFNKIFVVIFTLWIAIKLITDRRGR